MFQELVYDKVSANFRTWSLLCGLCILESPCSRIPQSRTMNPRISNPFKTISKPNLQSRIKDPQEGGKSFINVGEIKKHLSILTGEMY